MAVNPPKKVPYRVPTLKVTRADIENPARMYQAFIDYANDMQSFLQQFAATYNTHTVQK